MEFSADLIQTAKSLGFYLCLLLLIRFSGKRLAGQMTTFDLLVLIALAVVLQDIFIGSSVREKAVFLLSVLVIHRVTAVLCARFKWLKVLLRGKPRCLVRDGRILAPALNAEGLSKEELIAGLRKQGFDSVQEVKLAYIEETGHISAVER